MFDNYIFDMDGTLVDTSRDVIDGLRGGFEAENLKLNYTDEQLIEFVGPPLEDMIRNMAPQIGEEASERVVSSFRRCYSELNHRNSFLYPGVKETLELLNDKGKQMFVATNKPKKFANLLLEKFGLTMFRETFTSDYFDGKLISKSEMLRLLVSGYRLDKQKTVMIGDSKADIIGAADNGLKSFFLTYGFGDTKNMPKPTYIIDEFRKIL